MKEKNLIKIMNPCVGVVERIIPGYVPLDVYLWHIGRYIFSFTKMYIRCIRHESIVLDVACGVGYGSYLLARRANSSFVLGLDLSKEAVRYAKRNYEANLPNLQFIVGDATKIPIGSSLADIIISFETIEHLEDPDAFLAQCKRVLKEKGLLLLSTPNKYITLKRHIKNPYHISELFIDDLIEKLTSLKFKVIEIHGQRPSNLNMNKRSSRNNLISFLFKHVAKFMPVQLKSQLKELYKYNCLVPRITGLPSWIVKLYYYDTRKFEEYIANNKVEDSINKIFFPALISDIERDKYIYEVFIVIAEKEG